MKNNLIAFFLSLLVHLVILLLFLVEFPKDDLYKPPKYGSKERERISIKNFKFSNPAEMLPNSTPSQESLPTPPLIATQESQDSKESQPTPPKLATPDMPKPQAPKMTKPTKLTQESTKSKETPKTKEPTESQESLQSQESASQSLASSLKSHPMPSSPSSKPLSPSIYDYGKDMANQEIKELYGEDFYSLSLDERKFIEDNLSGIGRITQRYLKYPQIAGQMGQQGDNIVEFYLHPNGDISDLKLLTPSGFRLLDENSIHTIEIAYKDYPYPAVKTKIYIRVMYRIY